MYKTIRSKIKIFIILIILVVSIIAIKKLIVDPQPVKEIKMNTVYICGSGTEYPDDDQSRFYIEFKDDKTFILMHDDTRRNEEDYDEDGDGSRPVKDIYFGKYEIKNDNYIVRPTEGAYVGFKDTIAVKNNRINYYYSAKIKNNAYETWMTIVPTSEGHYKLGYINKNGISFDNNRIYFMLYNKSDIKKLPSSVEEFRKQFKMDKKAEQERLAEQSR